MLKNSRSKISCTVREEAADDREKWENTRQPRDGFGQQDVQCYRHSSGRASAEILSALQNTQILKKGFKRN